MNYNQIAILLLEGSLVAFLILLLFRLRKKLGIGVLFACLGLFQFVQVYLSSTVYVSITNDLIVSPGSSVFFTATLFALLIIYIKEDAVETKKIIYALFIVNIVMSILLRTLGWHFNEPSTHNDFNTSTAFFDVNAWVLFVGTIVLFLDSLLIIIIFEFISKKTRFLFLKIFITMLLVVSFDTLFFSVLVFWNDEKLYTIVTSGLMSKGFFALFYSIIFSFYIRYFDFRDKELMHIKIKDVFKPLSYKQKFQTAVSEIKKVEEARKLELIKSNKEKEKRIVELEKSNQKLKTTLDLLEKSESSKNEASKVAKIGYQDYDITTNTFSWSDYIYHLFGYDPKDGMPQVEEVLSVFDKKSKKIILQAVQDLDSKGISCDVELRLINLRKEEIWVRYVAQAVYNEQNKIVGRRGVMQNITESKLDQLKLKNSKEKAQASLELLENSERFKNEASKVAKIGYWNYNSITDTVDWSDYMFQIFGLKPQKNAPKLSETAKFFDEESQKKIDQITLDISTKGIPYDIELKFINNKNEEVWIRTKGHPIYNEHNEIIGRGGITQDITSTKKAQLELELSKEKIQASLELLEKSEHSKNEASEVAKIGYWEHNIISETVIWSDYLHRIYGSNPTDGIPSQNEFLERFDKKSKEKLEQATLDLLLKGVSYDIELKMINIKKEELWVRNVAQPIYNTENKIVGKRGVMQNITASKKAQLELEVSKDKIQSSLELLEKSEHSKNEGSKIAKIGYWEHNLETDEIVWSEYLYQIFDSNPKDGIPSQDEILGRFTKESQDKLIKATIDITTKGIAYDIELKFVNLKKEEVWLRNVAQPIYNTENKIVGKRGVMQNITASKKAQLELELSKQKLEASLDLIEKRDYSLHQASAMAKIGFWEFDIETETFIWSDYVYKLCGLESKDGIPPQKEIVNICDKASLKKLEQATLDLNLKGIPYDIELRLINFKKEEIWIRNVAQPIYNQENKIIGRRGVIHDITDSKRVLHQLELSKQEIQATLEIVKENEYSLKEAGRMARIGYWAYDKETDVMIWSEAIHNIYGTDPNKPSPNSDIVINSFDKESGKKLMEATENLITNGVSYDLELQVYNLKNEKIWIRNIGEPIYNDKNEIIGRRGVTQDISESKKAQLALEHSKKEIQTSLDLLELRKYSMDEASKVAKIGYFEHYITTNIFKWSDYLFYIHGFDPKKPVPSKEEFIQHLDKESREVLNKATLNLYTKGISYDIEMKVFNKIENKNIWVRSVAQPIYNDKNEIIGRRGVTQDITESKKAQLALEHSKKEIQNSLELLEIRKNAMDEASKVAKIGYHEYDIATDTFIWSECLYHIFGIDLEKPVPPRKEILALFDDESKVIMKNATQDLDLKGIPYDIELKLNNLKNEVFWVRNVAQPVYNQNNEIVGRRGVTQDITAQKIKQNELDIKSAKISDLNKALNEAQELSHIGNWEYIFETDSVTWSKELFNIFEREYKLGAPNYSEQKLFYTAESFTILEQAVNNCVEYEMPYDLELDIYTSNGSLKHIISRGRVLKDADKKVIGCFGTAQDITQIKLAQNELEFSKQEIQTTLELLEKSEYSKEEASKTAKIGFFEDDIVKGTRVWSDYLYEIFGVNPKEEIPSRKELASLMLSEEGQNKLEELILKLDTKGISFDVEMKMVNLRKEDIWIRFIAQPVYNSKNKIVKRRGVMQDITSSKKAQRELELSKQKIETALELVKENEYSLREAGRMAKIGYWSYDKQTDTIFWSEAVHQIYGNDPKEGVPELDVILSCFNDESGKKLVDATVLLATKGVPFEIELELTNLKNEKRWILNMGEPIFNDKKEIIGRRGVSQDITQRKLIENEIDNQNQKLFELNGALTMAQELAHVGNWLFNLSSRITEWSDETFRIWGFDVGGPTPDEHAIENRIHVDDLDLFHSAVNLAFDKGIPYDIEFRINIPNQEQKTLRSICQPLFDDDGKVVSLRGTNQDITAQKRAMLEIEKAEEMYRILTDNSNDLISLQEPDTTFKYISPSLKTLLGYEPSDFIGKKVFSLIHKDDIKRIKKAIEKRVYNEDYGDAISFRIRHNDGHYVWLEYLSSPVYKDNKISYFVTSSRDVTLWVKAKKEIQDYQTSLQKMTTEMTMIEENQKKEIASNIHDHLSQSLVISKMRINLLKKNPQLKEIDGDLNFIETHISEALENSRKITYELSPPVLYQLGIIDALNWLLDNVEANHDIVCQFNSIVNSIKLGDVKSITLYRSIQEVIKNAIKYANASLITLDLDKDDDGIYILLKDDGIGFDINVLKNIHNHTGSGFGLFTVQERIKNIQGKFTIESEKNIGTSVKIFIPLDI